MIFRSKLYAGLFPLLLSGCINQNITPTYPFKVQGYSLFVDDNPGSYYVISIDRRKYCYFWKKTEDEDHDLFIHDLGCDLSSDRVVILSGNNIIVASDAKDLEKEVVEMLNSILRNSEKIIVNSNEIDLIIF